MIKYITYLPPFQKYLNYTQATQCKITSIIICKYLIQLINNENENFFIRKSINSSNEHALTAVQNVTNNY